MKRHLCLLVCVQDQPPVVAHLFCVHVPSADRLQHEETHLKDALQGGRPGRKEEQSRGSSASLSSSALRTGSCVAGETHFIHQQHLQIC